MASTKQRKAARKNIKKAEKAWESMSHAERVKAAPSRPYRVHTKKWERLVRDLKRKGTVRSPEAVATATLGPASFLKHRVYPRRK